MDAAEVLAVLDVAPTRHLKPIMLHMKDMLTSADITEQRVAVTFFLTTTPQPRACQLAYELDVGTHLVRLVQTSVHPTPSTGALVAALAITALSNFTDNGYTQLVVESGTVPHVARFLPRATGLEPTYAYACLKVLADTLLGSPLAAQQALANDIVTNLKPHLTSQHDSSKLCAVTCAYHLLRHCPEVIPAMVNASYLPPVAALLRHEEPEGVHDAAGCMAHLCRPSSAQEAALRAASASGAIRTLSQRCLAHSDTQVRSTAAGALMVIATGPQQRQEIIDAGVLPLLVSSLQQTEAPELQHNAADCLHNIALGGCVYGHQLAAAGALQPLMAMLRGSTDEDVLRAGSCLGACFCLCKHKQQQVLPVVLQQATAVDSGQGGDESSTGVALVLAAMVLEWCAAAAQVVVDCGGVGAMVAVRARTRVPYAQQRLDEALAVLEGMGGGCAAAVSSAREEVRMLQLAQQAQQGVVAGGQARGKGSSSTSATTSSSSSKGSADAAHVCAKCGAAGSESIKLHRCAGCKAVRYCSKECQKSHWKMHKPHCAA